MNTIASTIDTIMQMVLSASVQITDFTPPRKVYTRTIPMHTRTFTMNGSPSGPNTISWRVTQTRNNLTAAPSIFEMKKNQAPVLWEDIPNRSSRYW